MKRLVSTILILGAASWVLAQESGQPQTQEPMTDTSSEVIEQDAGNNLASEAENIDQVLDTLGDELNDWSEADRQQLIDALENLGDMGGSVGDTLVPITAIILTLGMPIIIVGIVAYTNYRKKKLVLETVNEYLKSGRDIPAEVLDMMTSEAEKNHLHGGLILLGTGLGVVVFAVIVEAAPLIGIAAIIFCIGLAKLLVWKLDQKREDALDH